MSLVDEVPAQEINFEALGLDKNEYEAQIAAFKEFKKEVEIQQEVIQDKNFEEPKLKKEDSTSQDIIRQILERDGLSADEINAILNSFQGSYSRSNSMQENPKPSDLNQEKVNDLNQLEDNKYEEFKQMPVVRNNIHEQRELKEQKKDEEIEIPEDIKKMLDEEVIEEQKRYLQKMKHDEASLAYINELMAKEHQEKDEKAQAILLSREREDTEYVNRLIAEEIQAHQDKAEEEEKINEKYIKSLMDEEQKEKEKIADDQIKADCPICLDSLFSQEVFPLSNCTHLFHVECLETYIIEEIKKRSFPIKCPHPDCKQEIMEDEVKDSLQAHIEYQDLYDEYYIKSYVESNPNDYYHCPTADCKSVFYMDADQKKFSCPECKKSYCMSCKTDWHERLSCEEFQRIKRDQKDDKFEEFARKMHYVPCPKCQIYVERIEGCNAMTCTRCRTPFCYQCGKEGDGHVCNHKGGRVNFPGRPVPLPGIRLPVVPRQPRRYPNVGLNQYRLNPKTKQKVPSRSFKYTEAHANMQK